VEGFDVIVMGWARAVRLRLAGCWMRALGDVTGVALFTHVAAYRGRGATDNILGRPRAASYQGVPRLVFADPETAAAGLTAEQARRQAIDIARCSSAPGLSQRMDSPGRPGHPRPHPHRRPP
jgi:hypothetical protein